MKNAQNADILGLGFIVYGVRFALVTTQIIPDGEIFSAEAGILCNNKNLGVYVFQVALRLRRAELFKSVQVD